VQSETGYICRVFLKRDVGCESCLEISRVTGKREAKGCRLAMETPDSVPDVTVYKLLANFSRHAETHHYHSNSESLDEVTFHIGRRWRRCNVIIIGELVDELAAQSLALPPRRGQFCSLANRAIGLS